MLTVALLGRGLCCNVRGSFVWLPCLGDADSCTAGPWPVLQGGCSVAVVFRQEVQGDVTLKVEQTDLQLTTTRETATVFTFVAPRECVCRVCSSLTRRVCVPCLSLSDTKSVCAVSVAL